MLLTYHGHSMFKLKGKKGVVVTDPFDQYIGFSAPNLSADIVTVSHQHSDHNALAQISATTRRRTPFVIDEAGEYEIGGISVFGTKTHHDTSEGAERGENLVFTIFIDEVRVCHLGDLGHELSSKQLEEIGSVDVLLIPIGGSFTIGPELAIKTIRAIEPSIVIPMHYRTPDHDPKIFSELKTLDDFTKEYGMNPKPESKIEITRNRLGEETELVVMRST